MVQERRGRHIAAPFHLFLFIAAVLTACGSFSSAPQPDHVFAIVAGARVDVSPQMPLPTGGDMKATVALQRVGDHPIARELRIALSDANGQPVDSATVIVVGQMPGMKDAMLTQTTARPDGAGRYIANVVFPMTGAYEIQVIVTGRGAAGSLRFELDIAG